MDSPLAIDFSQPNAASSAPSPAAASGQAQVSFHEVLSVLNPLQYVPVVGNIYRALTGDSPPEAVRMIGSFIASALTGGPIGVAINAMVTAVEKLTGLDPDRIAHEVMASVGMVGDDAPAPALPEWTDAQRLAYGLGVAVPPTFATTTDIETDPVQSRAASVAYARTQQMEGPAAGHA
jgi:hypothetical protein